MADVIRLHLVVEGDVQGVGYRTFVKYVARGLKISGFVRNLPDGTVEIFCEGDSAVIEAFREKINIKSENGGPFRINVKGIKEETIGRLPNESDMFDIDYGDEAKNAFEKTNLERLEIGSLIMAEFRDSTSGKFDAMEQRYGAISGQMGQLTEELVKSNTKVSDKMGFLAHELVKSNTRISGKMDVLARELINSNESSAKLVETLISKLDKVIS